MNWLEKIKEGDVVIVGSFGIGTVQRVTQTEIILEEDERYRRSDGISSGTEEGAWNPLKIKMGTEEEVKRMREKIQKERILTKIEETMLFMMSLDDLKKIEDIIDGKLQEAI